MNTLYRKTLFISFYFLRWELIKENKKIRKKENTLSTKKPTTKTIKKKR